MMKVFGCFVGQHDIGLVALAATVCAFACLTAIGLLNHARQSSGSMRALWLGTATLCGGFGIWATHFIAILAFSPGVPSGFNIELTLVSLLESILITAVGFGTALRVQEPRDAWVGGLIFGAGVATMHYTGMRALDVAGHVLWDPVLVASSVLAGALLGGLALPIAFGEGVRRHVAGALLLALSVAGLHFAGMGAITIVPDPAVEVSRGDVSLNYLAVLVAAASIAIVIFAAAGLAFDIRERRRAQRESQRMMGLADAAVEGLIICDGDNIITVNSSFATLTGIDPAAIAGASLATCFPQEDVRRALVDHPEKPREADLRHRDGTVIPVEVILRSIDFAGRPHRAIAVRDLRDRKKAEQRISFLAHHDALTQLPNRSSFNQALDAAIESAQDKQESFAVLCLDLDRFKEINDLFGHMAGDQLLQSVGARVSLVLQPGQMMARLGGDEFAIIARDISDVTNAERMSETILQVFRDTNDAAAPGLITGCSIGIAFYPQDGTDRELLMRNGDTALYCAKADGRGTYRLFDAMMGARVRDRRILEHDLRQALAHNELRIVYQPQTSVKTGDVVGFEALLRWQHPERGDIPPSVFVPAAEDSGAILPIGEWVLRTVCREAAGWTSPLRVAVNVSAVQLHSAGFPAMVHETLMQTGLPPARLELEITETALIRDLTRALTGLRQLKALGVGIAMDDFGTGYSSLSNLRAFPFDRIKIDRSFVRSIDHNEQSAAIVRAVLGLGRGLNLPILAEGVETPAELSFLDTEFCEEAQGYLMGRPASIEQFRGQTHLADRPIDADDAGREGASRIAAA